MHSLSSSFNGSACNGEMNSLVCSGSGNGILALLRPRMLATVRASCRQLRQAVDRSVQSRRNSFGGSSVTVVNEVDMEPFPDVNLVTEPLPAEGRTTVRACYLHATALVWLFLLNSCWSCRRLN